MGISFLLEFNFYRHNQSVGNNPGTSGHGQVILMAENTGNYNSGAMVGESTNVNSYAGSATVTTVESSTPMMSSTPTLDERPENEKSKVAMKNLVIRKRPAEAHTNDYANIKVSCQRIRDHAQFMENHIDFLYRELANRDMQIVNKDNQIASMYKNFEEKAREMDGRLAEKDNALDAKQHEYEKISLILREAERKGVVKKVRETPMMDCLQATMESFNTLQAPRRPAGEEVILDGGVRIQTPVPTVPTKSQRKVRK